MITIDPGKSGGIAYHDYKDELIKAIPMPDTLADIADAIRDIKHAGNNLCIMESVGYTPGDGGKGAFTFGNHVGHLEAILYIYGISVERVSPQAWQKVVGLPSEPVKGLDAKQRAERTRRRKNLIKDFAQRRYPHCKVTLKTADALAMHAWAAARAVK